MRLQEFGYNLDDVKAERAYQRFIALADRKKEVTDRDMQAIVEEGSVRIPEQFVLDYLHVTSGTNAMATATVRNVHGGKVRAEAATGDGPVDAVYRAIDRATGIETTPAGYFLNAVTGGKDALGEVTVQVQDNGHVYSGRGISTDVIEASARAYVQALNELAHARARSQDFAAAVSEAVDVESSAATGGASS